MLLGSRRMFLSKSPLNSPLILTFINSYLSLLRLLIAISGLRGRVCGDRFRLRVQRPLGVALVRNVHLRTISLADDKGGGAVILGQPAGHSDQRQQRRTPLYLISPGAIDRPWMKKVWLLICSIVTVTRGFFRYRSLKLLAIKLASSSAVFPCAYCRDTPS